MLGLPHGLATCKAVDATQQRDLEKEDIVGLGNVAVVSSKQNNAYPLPFLRTPSSRFGSGVDIQPPKKRVASTCGLMERIYQQEKQDEIDLTIALFFYLNFILFNVARLPLFV